MRRLRNHTAFTLPLVRRAQLSTTATTATATTAAATATITPTTFNLHSDFQLEISNPKNWSNHIEETRALRSFTEETKRFRVPVLGRAQEELDLTTTKDNAVHILTQHPYGVHTFTNATTTTHSQQSFTNLHSLMPFGTPVPWLGALPNNDLLTFSPERGCLIRLQLDRGLGAIHYVDEEANNSRAQRHQYGFSYFGRSGSEQASPHDWGIAADMLSSHGKVLVWQQGGHTITLFQFGTPTEEGSGLRLDVALPLDGGAADGEGIAQVACPSEQTWTVLTTSGRQLVLQLGATFQDPVTVLDAVGGGSTDSTDTLAHVASGWHGQYTMGKETPWKPPTHLSFDDTARYGALPTDAYYTTMVGQPKASGHSMSMYASLRAAGAEEPDADTSTTSTTPVPPPVTTSSTFGAYDNDFRNQNPDYGHRFATKSIRMEQQDQLANVVHYKSDQYYHGTAPSNDDDDHDDHPVLVPVIEFVDTNDDVVRVIEAHLPPDALVGGSVSQAVSQAEHRRTLKERQSPPIVAIDEMKSTGELITLQAGGWVRVWEGNEAVLKEDLAIWKAMHGTSGSHYAHGKLELTGTAVEQHRTPGQERTTAPDLEMPKHGKENDGKQHVGGNTWAGGTGGSNTAGLGGRGGPYRLDGGHQVHQVSEELKNEVSAEAHAKAREMAEEAFQQRLQDIDLGQAENDTYDAYFGRVKSQVAQLQNVLENVRARAKERIWLKHTTFGELDDSKIVDGAAGERNVYKRRGSETSSPGTPQKQPKQLRFVFDVSGSMYRFNGQDGRLDRLLETAVMVMSALDGLGNRFQYSIVGHSGDGPSIPFVEVGHPPKDRGDQLRVLQRMVAHTQFCMSGDHTLEAAAHAIQEVGQAVENADESFVFVVSDANLSRYGISPYDLGTALTSNEEVNACAIFIASLSDEAARIEEALPAGTGHICFDTSDLPQLFRNLFAASFAEEL